MKQDWDEYNKNLESPDSFKDFGFYSLVSSAVGRKVWLANDESRLYLNTYTTYVAGPGVGKSAVIDRVRDIMFRIGKNGELNTDDTLSKYPENEELAIPTGPDNTSKVSLVKLMSKLGNIEHYNGGLYHHASLALALTEFSALFPSGMDPREVARFLTVIYDSGLYQGMTEKRGKETIHNGCLNLLSAAQPAFIYDCYEKKIFNEGLGARTWFIYEATPKKRNFNGPAVTKEMLEAKHRLMANISKLTRLVGPLRYTDDAREYVKYWYEHESDTKRLNRSPKLLDYYERKRVHVQKLAGIVCLSQSPDLSHPIRITHVKQAFAALESIEKTMDLALSTKPRNELFPIHELIEDLLNNADYEITELYKAVLESVNAREFVETLRSMIKLRKARMFRAETGEMKLTNRMDTKCNLNVYEIGTYLKEFETR